MATSIARMGPRPSHSLALFFFIALSNWCSLETVLACSTPDNSLGCWTDIRKALEDSRRELNLVFQEQEIPTFSQDLWKCHSLHRLQIICKGEKLKELPPQVGQLKDLSTLILSGNALSSLPESIGNLQNLRVLEVDNNELTELPTTLAQCSKLQVLNAANNKLSSLKVIADLEALETLNADHNQLEGDDVLPLDNLKRLKTLSVSCNRITSLPRAVGDLSALETLNIADNQIKRLPAEMGYLKDKTLKVVRLDGNPLQDLNRMNRILTKGKKPIKELLDFVRKQAAPAPAPKSRPAPAAKPRRPADSDASGSDSDDAPDPEADSADGGAAPNTASPAPSRRPAEAAAEDVSAAAGNGEGGAGKDRAGREEKKPKKMSRRQKLMWDQRHQQSDPAPSAAVAAEAVPGPGVPARGARAKPSAARHEEDSDESGESEGDGSGDKASSSESSDTDDEDSTDADKQSPVAIGGGGGGEVLVSEAFTGVPHKSEAEKLVEQGLAKDIRHARIIIAKRLGLAPAEGGKGKGGGGGSAPAVRDTMQIPAWAVGRVIGKGGANIKELQEKTGANIAIDSPPPAPGRGGEYAQPAGNVEVTISADTAAKVAAAREAITGLVTEPAPSGPRAGGGRGGGGFAGPPGRGRGGAGRPPQPRQ